MRLPVMKIVAHSFKPRDLVAGHPALDFINTVTARDAPTPLDWLDSYARLLEWAALSSVADANEIEYLRKMSARSPRRTAAALTRARAYRESLHEMCCAIVTGDKLAEAVVREVEFAWKRASSRAKLVRIDAQFEASLSVERSGLDFIVDSLALRAVVLLRRFPQARTRVCLGERCGWLFIDASKGGRRVWCDMATCGNAAKSHRHQKRLRDSA